MLLAITPYYSYSFQLFPLFFATVVMIYLTAEIYDIASFFHNNIAAP